MPAAALAQSTGTADFEGEIIVTGTRTQEVGGFQAPDSPKAKAVVTQEYIARNTPGQSVLDVINVVPGVSFQNNDAYGLQGGKLTIRGFDQTRVSYTLDGLQLNDTGNYEIYTNFNVDPEILEQVSVGQGSTDVDSPTASATGGTVNQRTRIPGRQMGGRFIGTIGEDDFTRGFLMFDTGEFTSLGTRAFISASRTKYDSPFSNVGKVNRRQFNGRIYQPIGSDGDFISLSGRYNRDRNNFFGSVQLRNDQDVPDGFPQSRDDRFYEIADCNIDEPEAGVPDVVNTCGTQFDRRLNPSNSWNLRLNSRFTLTDNLTLTVDPSYQYTKARGGGLVTGREGFFSRDGVDYTGFIGGVYYFGVDLNGDGDVADTCTPRTDRFGNCSSATNERGVILHAPSQTITNRYGIIAGLRWDPSDSHSIRFTYTRDDGHHRQTGEVGYVDEDGDPIGTFPVDDPIEDARGNVVQKRDRKSFAVLNQFATEWRGLFGPLTANVGLRLPRFTRDLENFCFTTSSNGFLDCFNGDDELEDAYRAANPTVQGPQKRVFHYSKLLPNLGLIYDFTPRISGFASYSKGLSVPSTDNLYNAFFFAPNTDQAKPDPETTDTVDAGLRYRSSRIQAQVAGWFTKFNNRLASAYDPELERSVFRNLGRVDKWGIDASIGYQPIRPLTLYAFGSLNESEIKDNLQIGGGEAFDCEDAEANATGLKNCAFTKGKRESGSPIYMFGTSVLYDFGVVELGATAKRTGPRYVYDTNRPTFTGDVDLTGAGGPTVVYGAKTPAYWLVNLDARLNMGELGIGNANLLSNTYLQLNVYNLFDKLYVGGFGGNLNQGISSAGVYDRPGFVQIGAPRTVSLSLNVGF